MPAAWLRQLYETHGDELFSANVRGPIPSRRSRQNINFAIGETAKQHPHRFWAYNNGITALVNDVRIDDEGHLEIIGIAIVNGAQTTGALARVPAADLADAQVLARFVKSRSREVIDDIIRYNNSQNPISRLTIEVVINIRNVSAVNSKSSPMCSTLGLGAEEAATQQRSHQTTSPRILRRKR